jgi:UDP-glucose 4-epimerase
MNILITGGLGHIGSKLIKKLSILEMGNLTIVDNLSTHRYCSLFNLDYPIKFLDKCISEITVKDLETIDVVIHLAAITNAAGSFKNKEKTEEINLKLTSKFIKICDKANCKFIFPSSTSVYGAAVDVVDENNNDYLNPQSPYAETKIGVENLLKNYNNDYLILRFGTIFGTSIGMRFHTAINKFCYETSLGKPLTIWKENYNQYRPYLGLNDAISSIIFLIGRKKWNETYNVLTKNYKLSEIVSIINKISSIKDINWIDTPLINQYSYKVDDTKLKNLGWKSNDDIKECIKNTLEQLKNLKSK